jgi:hypothetical protein
MNCDTDGDASCVMLIDPTLRILADDCKNVVVCN